VKASDANGTSEAVKPKKRKAQEKKISQDESDDVKTEKPETDRKASKIKIKDDDEMAELKPKKRKMQGSASERGVIKPIYQKVVKKEIENNDAPAPARRRSNRA